MCIQIVEKIDSEKKLVEKKIEIVKQRQWKEIYSRKNIEIMKKNRDSEKEADIVKK